MPAWVLMFALPDVEARSPIEAGGVPLFVYVKDGDTAARIEDIPRTNGDFRNWHEPAVGGRAEHARSARVFQTSTCSAIARASSTSMPRYLTVLSSLVCPSSHES